MITLAELQALFESAEALPSKPSYEDFPVYVITDVIDEDKTVKWNKEEIKRRMAARDEETKRLRQVKKAAIENAHNQALAYISQQTGLPEQKAMTLWTFIIESYKVYAADLWQRLDAQINLYNALK